MGLEIRVVVIVRLGQLPAHGQLRGAAASFPARSAALAAIARLQRQSIVTTSIGSEIPFSVTVFGSE
jgi:hypothetical protein